MKRIFDFFAVVLISMCLCSCSGGLSADSSNNEETAVENLVISFLEEIKDTSHGDRDMEKLFELLHYEDSNEQWKTMRLESFQDMVIKEYEIVTISYLYSDIYVIEINIEDEEAVTETAIFYAVKINEEWKLSLGVHNIPKNIIEMLDNEKIEIPVNPVPEGAKSYSLDKVLF